jgi:hypothetical protein
VCNDPEGADRLLAELRWQPGEAFARALARIAPRGPFADGDDDAYRAARLDLDQVSRT